VTYRRTLLLPYTALVVRCSYIFSDLIDSEFGVWGICGGMLLNIALVHFIMLFFSLVLVGIWHILKYFLYKPSLRRQRNINEDLFENI